MHCVPGNALVADFTWRLLLMVLFVAVSATLLVVSPQIQANRRLAVLSTGYEGLEFWKGEDQEAIGGYISHDRQLFGFSELQGVMGGTVAYTDVVKVNNTHSCGHTIMVQLEYWDATETTPLYYLNITMFDSQGVQQGNTVHLVPDGSRQTVDSGFVYIAAGAWFRFKWDIHWQEDATVSDRMNIALTLVIAEHDVAVTDVRPYQTIIGEGSSTRVDVQVANDGAFAETVDVALYYDEELLETRSISLASQTSHTFHFTWNTTGVMKGIYGLSAVADTVLNESNVIDNIVIDGWILVTIPGDVNGDREVDIFDIVHMAGDYGKPPPPLNDPNCDLDGDGDIDIFDIVIAAGHYSKSW